MFQILFEVSNNEAEYEALLHGLLLVVSLGIKRLLVYGDSLLVAQQVNKEWNINKDTMGANVMEVRKLENKFSRLKIHHAIRDNTVGWPSIAQGPKEPDREVLLIKVDWRVAFINYIQEHKLPLGIKPKSAKATRILRCSKGYVLVRGNLYKHGSASGIIMKCVSMEEGKEILQENHVASRTLLGKAFRSGFYWLTALADAKALMSQLMTSSPYHLYGHLHARVLT
jgi:hypothetical protein